jgi:hypothetical protein
MSFKDFVQENVTGYADDEGGDIVWRWIRNMGYCAAAMVAVALVGLGLNL